MRSGKITAGAAIISLSAAFGLAAYVLSPEPQKKFCASYDWERQMNIQITVEGGEEQCAKALGAIAKIGRGIDKMVKGL